AAAIARNRTPLRSTTTKGRSFVSTFSRVNFWTPNPMAMMIGMSARPTRNALDRVSVVNSDTATMRALFFIGLRHDGRGQRGLRRGRPRDADEDIVQRRPCDFEVVHRAARRELLEEALGIAVQPNFLQLAVVVDGLHTGQPLKRGDAAGRTDAHRVEAVLRLNLLERAVENLLPAEDHEDAIAHPLGGSHVVGAEDDRRAA